MKFKEGSLPRLYKDRVEYLYRFQEMLRLFHNAKAEDYKKGKITLETFRTFQINWFESRNVLLCVELNKCKEHFKKVTAVAINIDDMEED